MDRIHDAARSGQNALERLMNALPGFKGYREKELRRDTDRILRDHLAARLDLLKKALNEAADAATRSGGLDTINDVETARKRLDRVSNRIRFADRGYAPLFAVLKVDEAALARVYDFDVALIEGVDAIARAVAPARAEGGAAAVKAMIAEIDLLDARLNDRESVLRGIQ
jgi:hypothetical protein